MGESKVRKNLRGMDMGQITGLRKWLPVKTSTQIMPVQGAYFVF